MGYSLPHAGRRSRLITDRRTAADVFSATIHSAEDAEDVERFYAAIRKALKTIEANRADSGVPSSEVC